MIPSLAVYASDTETGSVTSWSLQSLRTGTIVVTSGFSGITEFGYLLSQFVGLVSGNEYRLVIRDYVAGCMCLGLFP